MSIIPGSEPRPEGSQPMLADEPLPPGEHDIEETVDALARQERDAGSDEAAQAQESKETEGDPDPEDAEETDDADGSTQEGHDPNDPEQDAPDVS
ncbi:hypothetical protein [uncultured Serinicoccus sp.]|uniref:hypothetical protein n=1 Tax=uncultured Serinicoccus sp. TaxID=735514 RepID=UPI002613313B|nr:hypothetical protein [uncultured Serinicoccus sp.]